MNVRATCMTVTLIRTVITLVDPTNAYVSNYIINIYISIYIETLHICTCYNQKRLPVISTSYSGWSREGAWGAHPPPSLIFRQNWGLKSGKKHFLSPAPHSYLRVRMTAPLPYLKVWIRHCNTTTVKILANGEMVVGEGQRSVLAGI